MPAVFFKGGSVLLSVGDLEFAVTGLDLPFTPASMQVSVRAPSTDSDLITAYVVGALSTDGFTVQFSSAPSSDGYYLDWTAWAGDVVSTSATELSITYSDLFREVKRFLGYGDSSVTLTDAQTEEVDDYIQAGVRQFYYPPAMEGADVQHEWSFLKPVGQVTTTIGTSSVALSSDFGRLLGNVEFESSLHLPPAISCPEGLIRARLASDSDNPGPPRIVCVRHLATFGDNGQLCEMLMWPIPDDAYLLTFRQESDGGKLSETLRPFPLGGPRYAGLVLESCLAIAEQRANDETGLHTDKFKRLLISAVIQDRKFSARFYGALSASSLNGYGPSDFRGHGITKQEAFPLTYHGVTW